MTCSNNIKMLGAWAVLLLFCCSTAKHELSKVRENAFNAINALPGDQAEKGQVYDAIDALYAVAQRSEEAAQQVRQDAGNVVQINKDRESENQLLRSENDTLKRQIQEAEGRLATANRELQELRTSLRTKERERDQLVSKQQELSVRHEESSRALGSQIEEIKKLEQLIGAGLVTDSLSQAAAPEAQDR